MYTQINYVTIRCIIQENGIIRREKDMFLLGRLSFNFPYADLTDESKGFFYHIRKALHIK